MCKPLCYPEGCTFTPSRLENWCTWVPIFGWLVAAVLSRSRCYGIESSIEQQLRLRDEIPDEVWPDAEERAIARRIAQISMTEIDWPNDHFIPGDPFEIMVALRTGDLCELSAMVRIEEEFGVDLAQVMFVPGANLTFGEIVKWIKAERQKHKG